jgi:CopG family nickel-responsive transcriptional regulator
MQRVTITLDDDLMAEMDRLIARRGYQNRSEAVRDLVRAGIQQTTAATAPEQQCVAALVYVYDHGVRALAKRLTHCFHDHHDMAVSTLHMHLDHKSCMEVTVLKGRAGAVAGFAEQVIAERGVKHGRLVTVPVEISAERHAHGQSVSRRHEHAHVR